MNGDEKPNGFKTRALEVIVSVVASILTSALVVSWTLSATLENFRTRLGEHDARLAQAYVRIDQISDVNASQATALGVNASQYAEIIRRLDRIEAKQESAR